MWLSRNTKVLDSFLPQKSYKAKELWIAHNHTYLQHFSVLVLQNWNEKHMIRMKQLSPIVLEVHVNAVLKSLAQG